jgi:hypothetical protein
MATKNEAAMAAALRKANLTIGKALEGIEGADASAESLGSALRSVASGNVACDSGCGGSEFLKDAASDPAVLEQKARSKVELLAALENHLSESSLANVERFTAGMFRTADGNVGCDSGCGGSSLAEAVSPA